jgi:hypothetical protein
MAYFYVDPNGSDANDGRSAGSPKLTLQAAINAAGDGDTIRMKAGTYSVAGTTTINGKSLEIIVYSPSKKWSKGVLDGPGSGDLLAIANLGSGQWVRLIGLKLKNGGTGVAVSNQSAGSYVTAFGCWFDETLSAGLSGGAGGTRVHSCTLVGLGTGISASGDVDMYGSTLFDVGTGLSVSGTGTATWKNNVFGGTRATDVSLASGVTAVADYNGYAGSPSTSVVTKGAADYGTLSAWSGASGQDGNSVDPSSAGLMSESPPYDAHLNFASALKDIGTNIYGVCAQYGDGTFRPESGADNMGAWKTNVGVGSFNRIKDARTLYVRAAGSDLSGNGTETAPYATVQHAIDTLKGHAINAVVTIDIGAGAFSDPVVVDDELVVSGVEGPAIVLSGAGAGSTTIDGASDGRVLKFVGSVFVQLRGFTLGPVAGDTRYIEIGGKAKVEVMSGGTVVVAHSGAGGEGVAIVSGMLSVAGQLTVGGAADGVKAAYGGIVSIPAGGRLDVDGASSRALLLDTASFGEIGGTLDIGTSVRGVAVTRGAVLAARSGAVISTSTSGPAVDVDLNGTVAVTDGLTATVTAAADGVVASNGSLARFGGTLSLSLASQAAKAAVAASVGTTVLCGKLTTSKFETAVRADEGSTVKLDDADFGVSSNVSAGTWMLDANDSSHIRVDAISNVSGWANYTRAMNGSRCVLNAASGTLAQASQSTMHQASKMSSVLLDGGTHDCFNASSYHAEVTEFGLVNSANSPVWRTGGSGTTFRTNTTVVGTLDTGTPDGGLAFSS